MPHATYDEIAGRILALPYPALIAIDGLPVSGKSTLADRLVAELGLEAVFLDDFIRAPAEWPTRTQPAFPFEYIRYDAFLATIRSLTETGEASFHPFDWSTLAVVAEPKIIRLERPVLIEGVSSLHPAVCDLYGLRIFVDSDRGTTLDAAFARGVGDWEAEWRHLFLQSADLYLQSGPRDRADLIYAGRGITP